MSDLSVTVPVTDGIILAEQVAVTYTVIGEGAVKVGGVSSNTITSTDAVGTELQTTPFKVETVVLLNLVVWLKAGDAYVADVAPLITLQVTPPSIDFSQM